MLQKITAKLFLRNTFAKNVALLSGATFVAQALGALTLPVLTRIYSPTDFGVFAVYSAILGIIAVISCFRYELAISIASDDTDAANLLILSVIVAGLTSVIFWIFADPVQTHISLVLKTKSNVPFNYFWAVALAMFLVGISSAIQAWTARQRRYPDISRSRISQAIGGAFVNISYGLVMPSPQGLIVGHLSYSGLGIFGLVRNIARLDLKNFTNITVTSIVNVGRKYWRLPVFSVPEALFNSASWHIPVLMMIGHVTTSELGQLMLATRVVGLPMTLIGASVSQVYIAEAPSRFKNGSLKQFTRQTILSLVKIGFVPLLLVAIVSPFAFPYLFGAGWQRAGVIMMWIAPWFLMQFICSPILSTLYILNEFKLGMFLQFFGLVIRILFVQFAITGPVDWIIELYALSGIFVYAMLLYYIDRRITKFQMATKIP